VLPAGYSLSVYIPLIYRRSMPIPYPLSFHTVLASKTLCKREAASPVFFRVTGLYSLPIPVIHNGKHKLHGASLLEVGQRDLARQISER
jgi:hypothetical protein